MSRSNVDDDQTWGETEAGEAGHISGDELYMMTGGSYILCSVRRPSTQWIESNAIADLGEWR